MKYCSVNIRNEDSVANAISTAKEFCFFLSMDRLGTNLVASAVSEIASNVIKYGIKGRCVFSIIDSGRGIRIKTTDCGKGIDDISQALEDGFTTHQNSLGLGLGVAKRAVDYFYIESNAENGTTVIMEKWMPTPKNRIEYAAISLPDPNYHYNGDGYFFKEFNGDSLFVAIIDGLGEGYNAWKTTKEIKKILANDFMLDINLIIKKCEAIIKDHNPDSGAAMSLLRVTPYRILYLGVGDTHAKLYTTKTIPLDTQSGIIGAFPLPTLREKIHELKSDSTIVLCTDGIQERLSRKSLPLKSSSQIIAETIFTNYRREYGDATVLVIKTRQS